MSEYTNLDSPAEADRLLDELRPMAAPYADELVDALHGIGRRIRAYGPDDPTIVSAAFWLRRSNIQPAVGIARARTEVVRPRGLVLHIAPANVETMFLYSWAAAFLSGNASVVRLGRSRGFATELILRAVREVLGEFALLPTSAFVSYDSSRVEITSALSRRCEARMCWGGDETIRRIRALSAPIVVKDLYFADKRSIALIDGDSYAAADEVTRDSLARSFVVDAWTFWQMACSSPHRLIWKGRNDEIEDFWTRVESEADKRVPDEPMLAMNRFVEASSAAMDGVDVDVYRRFVVVTGESSTKGHPGGGYFCLDVIEGYDALPALLDDRTQTLAYWGVQSEGLARRGLKVDRIVPVGQALNFSLVWDGYDLLAELVRIQTVG